MNHKLGHPLNDPDVQRYLADLQTARNLFRTECDVTLEKARRRALDLEFDVGELSWAAALTMWRAYVAKCLEAPWADDPDAGAGHNGEEP